MFSGVTFRSADTLVLVRRFFLWSCNACLFSFENVTLKTGLQNSLACHMVKRQALAFSECWKASASLEEHLILFDFIFFFLCPLSLSFLSHWLCDRVSNLFIYFHSWLSSFPLWCTGYCHPSENRTAATKKKLFILKVSWHRTNKSVSVHTMYLCHPSSSFFSPFLNSSDRLFFEMKADIIFPVRPECLWNLPCCCSLITCTLPTPW